MSFVTQGVALKPINLVCLRLSQVISLTPPMKKKPKKNKTQYSSVTLVKSLHHCQFLSLR